MGYARILSGGPDGRYSIELDYGADQKAALLTALNELLARIDNAIASQQVLITEADAKEAVQVARVEAAQAEVIAAAASLPPGSPKPDTLGFKFELAQLAQMKSRHAPLRLKLDALKFDRAQTLRRAAAWAAFNPTETRSAWCVDLTEDAAVGSYVATADIPGESNLIVLAPGCRPWQAGDGILTAREIMSPAQAFLNAAILPGWQRFMPTYRWGTCTAIDEDADTMSVSLASQPSSAQSLVINQASTLTGVPVVYMTCNAKAFEVGDRVVVQFIGQSWASPRVIGFLDNPKPCELFTLLYITDTGAFYGLDIIGTTTLSTQDVYKDDDAYEVTAPTPYVLDAGLGGALVFFGWNDGVPTLSRQDLSVDASATYTARYATASGFRFSGGSFGFSTASNPPAPDVTTYKRTAFLIYPSGLTVTSGLVEGYSYDSGWTSYAAAYSYLVGSVVTGTASYLGQTISLTFEVRNDPTNINFLNLVLTDAAPLYAV